MYLVLIVNSYNKYFNGSLNTTFLEFKLYLTEMYMKKDKTYKYNLVKLLILVSNILYKYEDIVLHVSDITIKYLEYFYMLQSVSPEELIKYLQCLKCNPVI